MLATKAGNYRSKNAVTTLAVFPQSPINSHYRGITATIDPVTVNTEGLSQVNPPSFVGVCRNLPLPLRSVVVILQFLSALFLNTPVR